MQLSKWHQQLLNSLGRGSHEGHNIFKKSHTVNLTEELSTLSFGNISTWAKYFHMTLLMLVSQLLLMRIFWFLEKSHTHTLRASEGLCNKTAEIETLHECNQEQRHRWSQGNRQPKICQVHDKECVR